MTSDGEVTVDRFVVELFLCRTGRMTIGESPLFEGYTEFLIFWIEVFLKVFFVVFLVVFGDVLVISLEVF